MANHSKVFEHYPAMRDFKQAELFVSRGDVLAYQRNLKTRSFSTDGQGFRHTTHGHLDLSFVQCTASPRYGVVLGPSTIFGTGIAGNMNTLPSLLSERFDIPFANAGMPGGSSRTMQAVLVGLLSVAKNRPSVVVLSNGGDLANFCSGSRADPIFGSPNQIQLASMRGALERTEPDAAFERMITFTRIWTSAIMTMCRFAKIPLVMIHYSAFFDKSQVRPIERDCALGETTSSSQRVVFDNYRKFSRGFYECRQKLADSNDVPLAGLGLSDKLTFMDEFHLDKRSLGLLTESVGDAVAKLLGIGSSNPTPKATQVAAKSVPEPSSKSKSASKPTPKAAPKPATKPAAKAPTKSAAKPVTKSTAKTSASKSPAKEAPAKAPSKASSKAKTAPTKKAAAAKKK